MFSKKCKVQLEELNEDLPSIYVIGAPKRTKRNRLPSSLSLDGKDIEAIDFDDDTLKIVEDVKSLHLNHNKIKSWSDFAKLLQNMPGLKSINLSCNPFEECIDLSSYLHTGFQYACLNSLILNETNISWQLVMQILKYFPNLSEFHLSKNENLTLVEYETGNLDNYQHLKINEFFYNCNNCSNPRELQNIGRLFPNLIKLICLENLFEQVHIEYDAEVENDENNRNVHSELLNMTCLNISDNKILTWDSIDYLNNFPQLIDLKISGQPLFQGMTKEYIWNQLVSRLDNIKKLNGSVISEEDKIDANRAFVRYYLNTQDKPNRFHELVAKYPDVQALVEVDLSSCTDKIRITLIYKGNKTEIDDFDLEMTPIGARDYFIQLLDLPGPATNYILLHWDQELIELNESIQLPMLKSKRKLVTFKIRPGDSFELVEKT